MQLGKLCGNFKINLPLHKLVLLSREVVLPSHTYLFLPCDIPSLGPAQPFGVNIQWIGSRTDVDFYSFFNLVLTHENHSYKTKCLSLVNV